MHQYMCPVVGRYVWRRVSLWNDLIPVLTDYPAVLIVQCAMINDTGLLWQVVNKGLRLN